jgi:FMN phosphatase YigB (HAD superfamily)
LFDAADGLCNLYDEGGISSRGFYEEINRRFPLGVDYEGFIPLWNDIFTEDSDVTEVMRQVRLLRPVYLLSNVNELHWEFVKARFPALGRMDGWVLSYEVRAKKPAREIYMAALEAAGAGKWESVFIDDIEENTRAARSCGIHGITFTGAARLKEDLKTLGLIGV